MNLIIEIKKFVKRSNSRNSSLIYNLFRKIFAKLLGLYPFYNKEDIYHIKKVLNSGIWNSSYSLDSKVKEVEDEFCKFLKVDNCIMVSSGGVGIEILMRILTASSQPAFCTHIRHTCPATPFSIYRSGVIPLPTNPSEDLFSLPKKVYQKSSSSRLVLSTHFWGYPEQFDKNKSEYIIEDSCLSFDTYFKDGRHVGTYGKAGVFSFGCLKPIQAGEGGLICTNDRSLAKEIRIMQNYANKSLFEIDNNDIDSFGLNGRLSCIQAALISSQLKNYKKYTSKLRRGVYDLIRVLHQRNLPIKVYIPKDLPIENLGFSSVILTLDENLDSIKFRSNLRENGINTIPTFFQDILSLTYFKEKIISKLSVEQKEVYLNNINNLSNYAFENNLIAVSRRWISNKLLRNYLIGCIEKSLYSMRY